MKLTTCLLTLALVGGCVLEDEPINGSGGTGGTGGNGTGGNCGSCSGDTPVCNEATMRCVQCTAADAAACIDDTPRCDPATNECVACLVSADCTRPDAARCDTATNECVACESPVDCESVANAPICNDRTCVQCTPENEAQDCLGDTCNPATFACTGTAIGSRSTCETCVTDSDCGDLDTRCVAMLYQGNPFPNDTTGFCLKTTEGGCERPFSITLHNGESLSGGPTDDYCAINQDLATCPAVNALLNDTTCENGTDNECPQPSGLCRQVGALSNRCTYRCNGDVQCDNPPNPGSSCGPGSGAENYCGG